jgi:Ferredoxin-like domain in Api92-like protein
MPNHISNRLTIEASIQQLEVILAAIQGKDPDGTKIPIDFHRIIPMPDLLRNTGCGLTFINGKRTETWWSDNERPYNHLDRRPDRLLTDEEQTALAMIGFTNWYEWSIANWGTKWNAYSQQCDGNVLTFLTAWAAPLPVMTVLTRRYPEARFTLEYADEDIGSNAGIAVYEGGESHSETVLHCTAAAKLWFELNGYDPSDLGYDPITFEYVGEKE